jgi:hypothetical protein
MRSSKRPLSASSTTPGARASGRPVVVVGNWSAGVLIVVPPATPGGRFRPTSAPRPSDGRASASDDRRRPAQASQRHKKSLPPSGAQAGPARRRRVARPTPPTSPLSGLCRRCNRAIRSGGQRPPSATRTPRRRPELKSGRATASAALPPGRACSSDERPSMPARPKRPARRPRRSGRLRTPSARRSPAEGRRATTPVGARAPAQRGSRARISCVGPAGQRGWCGPQARAGAARSARPGTPKAVAR